MPDEKTGTTPHYETPEDRFEKDMEELEAPGWRYNRKLVVTVLALIIVFGVGITYLFMTEKQKIKPVGPTVMQIELLEPRPGKLANTPTKFRWETISSTKYYSFTLAGKASGTVVVQRASNVPSITLTVLELPQLIKGITYVWKVDAYADTGKILGHGEATFDL